MNARKVQTDGDIVHLCDRGWSKVQCTNQRKEKEKDEGNIYRNGKGKLTSAGKDVLLIRLAIQHKKGRREDS